jgi:hypothetical protein
MKTLLAVQIVHLLMQAVHYAEALWHSIGHLIK